MSLCSANTVGVDRSHLSENAFILSSKGGFYPKIVFDRDDAVAREVFACSQNVVRFKATNTQRRIDGVFTRVTSSDRPDAFAGLVFIQRRTNGFPLILRLKATRDLRYDVIGTRTSVDLERQAQLSGLLTRLFIPSVGEPS
ncbi:hypothetical protein [Sphingomonas sp. PAMC 26617]|uniref:hypothetical protein n=1 Tax=Sphingomonas sp. PAMC 26617 TaxID=1112216 RepID=UPI001E385699|nr:hypothetical protein [Sphingomonas sp. PAMC 26617]